MFGPGSVPLFDPGSHTGFPLSTLAQWDSYGITLSAADATSEQHIIEGKKIWLKLEQALTMLCHFGLNCPLIHTS